MMHTLLFLLLAVLLLLVNAFFVLVEFAIVKARPTRIEELEAAGDPRAGVVQYIQTHLDQFLSLCQVGITFASIGLGFVGEPAVASLVKPVVLWAGLGGTSTAVAHGIAVSIAYVLVSYLHIVIGELVPKTLAIRHTDASALYTARWIKICYHVLFLPLWLLNSSANAVLRLIGIPSTCLRETHSEDEIRIILDQSQSSGMMSFRRLLFIENVLDFGDLAVRNAMRPRNQVRTLSTLATREDNEKVIRDFRHSRYPLLADDPEQPVGYVHVKNWFLAERETPPVQDLQSLARPCLKAKEDDPLEPLLAIMQRRGNHLALVYDAKGKWSGIITLEDVVEELIGAIEEEFPVEEPVYLSDALTPERVLLDIEARSIVEAVRQGLKRIPAASLPLPAATIQLSVEEREKTLSSYVGKRLAIPHARFAGLQKPCVAVLRLKTPIPAPVPGETIHLLFLLLTPTTTPRVHQLFLARIARMLESEFLEDRLHDAATPADLLDAIRTAEQTALD
jgi:CBS domain containing-hemolysin-like protein/mannitol/fructose-specific phosphotransferase system IIA component (Ntr-type)